MMDKNRPPGRFTAATLPSRRLARAWPHPGSTRFGRPAFHRSWFSATGFAWAVWVPLAIQIMLMASVVPVASANPPEKTKIGEVRGPFLWTKMVQGDYEDVFEEAKAALSIANFPVNNIRDYRESFGRRFEQIGGGKMPFAQYRILDFCNVQYAVRNLTTDLRMGIFMPCKLVIHQALEGGPVTLMTVNPDFMHTTLNNPALMAAARKLEAVIREVFDSVDF